MKNEIRALATSCGFDDCRFARAGQAPHSLEYFSWLRAGSHGGMTWLGRDPARRADPSRVLFNAKTLLVLAKNYFQGPNPRYHAGKIARYAWGSDYHEIMLRDMAPIEALLRENGGRQKCYVDTGPILERDYAAQAGIGWHGKSTMLINQRLGTWFFLADVFTTLKLLPDEPVRERCGTCERCITACPTGAITGPHQLDARRCISYLTIELKGAIPLKLRPLIGDRIFGCDDCLDACPWNRFAKESRESAFSARRSTTGMSLREYLELNDDEFRRLFKNSPIKRIKRRGFLRNVCVALGNVGDSSDLPALEHAAADADPLIAEHATWAINQIRDRQKQAHPEVESR